MKRFTAFLLSCSLLLALLSSCGQKTAESAPIPASVPDSAAEPQDVQVPPYYSVEYLTPGEAFGNSDDCLWYEGRFLCTDRENRNDQYPRILYWADPNEGDGQDLPLDLTGNEAIMAYCAGGDGNVYVILSDVIPDVLEGPEGLTWDGFASSRLLCLDQSGQLLFEMPLPQDGGASYGAVTATANGTIYAARHQYDPETGFFSEHYLDLLDQTGTVESFSIPELVGSDQAVLGGFLTAQDGSLLLQIQVNDWPRLYGFDPTVKALTDPYFETSSDMMWPTLCPGGFGADYYSLDENTGLISYTLSGETHSYFKLTELPSTVPEDARLIAVPEENVWLFQVMVNSSVYLLRVTGLWEQPPESEKIQLILGATQDHLGSTSLSDTVVAFNILNPDYELVLRDYSGGDPFKSSEDIREQLNLDIINGDGPDILLLDGYDLSCDTYAGNGFLRDLYSLMDGDPEFDRSGYLENVWQACENQGKLYGLVPSFTVATVVTSRDYIDVPEGWTPTEFQQVAAASDIPLMEGLAPNLSYTDSFLANYLLGDGLQNYIDGDTCDFASGEFAAMLELLKGDYPVLEEPETVDESLRVKSGQVLMQMTFLSSPEQLQSMKFEYGDNYALTGYPSPNRSKISISLMYGALGISQETAHPEACWSFLKMVLEATDQKLSEGWGIGFSTNRAVLTEALRRTTLPADDPDAYNLETSYGTETETVDVTLEPLTQAEAEEFLALIESTACTMVDAETRAIVQEEVPAFFDGDKTAQQVAEIIQNRVQLHLWEQA